jgi:hypothetical protein
MRCAGKSLRDCIVPTLLLVGGWDGPVIDMNKDALDNLAAPGLVPTFTTVITNSESSTTNTTGVVRVRFVGGASSEGAEDHTGRNAPVRGARQAGGGGPPGPRLVQEVP